MALDLEPSVIGKLYFLQSPKRKKMLEFLLVMHQKHDEVFPSTKTIARCCDCNERTVRRFLNDSPDMRSVFFAVKREFSKGRQTTNRYRLTPAAYQALEWLKMYGYLRAKKTKHARIFSSMENAFKCPPPPPRKCPPSYTDSSSSEIKRNKKESSPFMGHLEKIRISLKTKKYLQRTFSESVIVEAIESSRKAWESKKVKTTLEQYLVGSAKRIQQKRLNL